MLLQRTVPNGNEMHVQVRYLYMPRTAAEYIVDITWSATGSSLVVLRQISTLTGAVGVLISRSLVCLVHVCVIVSTGPAIQGADVVLDLNSSALMAHLKGSASVDTKTLQMTAEGK
jgi:hypothetical protein